MKFVLLFTIAIILLNDGVHCLSDEQPPENFSPARLRVRRYTDWNGCMAICTPGCAIPNCNQWCTRVCCKEYSSPQC